MCGCGKRTVQAGTTSAAASTTGSTETSATNSTPQPRGDRVRRGVTSLGLSDSDRRSMAAALRNSRS